MIGEVVVKFLVMVLEKRSSRKDYARCSRTRLVAQHMLTLYFAAVGVLQYHVTKIMSISQASSAYMHLGSSA